MFKVGDIVVCVQPCGHILKFGEKYKVIRIAIDTDENETFYHVQSLNKTNTNGDHGGYFAHRFILFTKKNFAAFANQHYPLGHKNV